MHRTIAIAAALAITLLTAGFAATDSAHAAIQPLIQDQSATGPFNPGVPSG